MLTPNGVPTQFSNNGQESTKEESATQKTINLVTSMKDLGLTPVLKDKDFNNISWQFNNTTLLLRNPEFISRLSQDFYVSSDSGASWFTLMIRNGKIKTIKFLLTMIIKWMIVYNERYSGVDYIVLGYFNSEENQKISITVVPGSDLTPERIMRHFPQLIGETNKNTKERGALICHLISQYKKNLHPRDKEYLWTQQGFWKPYPNTIRFNPPHPIAEQLLPYLSPGVTARQYPKEANSWHEDISTIIKPLFSNQKELQLCLLYRFTSWFSFLFIKRDVYSDQVLIVKSSLIITIKMLVALFKNTSYDSLDAPSIGPNIKPLKFDIENINDGMVVVIDNFACDQIKKSEKGYDLLINDVTGATDNNNSIHHVSVLISDYADTYIPKEMSCVLDMSNVASEYVPEAFRTALKRLDSNLVSRIEHEDNCGEFINLFNQYVDEAIVCSHQVIPHSKRNIYIMLITALRIYNEWYSPLFAPDIEEYITDWLCSQEQDRQPLHDMICSEYGRILNQKIADGYFQLTLKEETTLFDKGSHTIIVDRKKRQIYVETADSFEIAKTNMTSIADTDSLTAALYSGGYLPHNAKNEKSIRIAAITSDGIPYPLYVHSINYTLLTQENKQHFELLDKEPDLLTYEEMTRKDFLPLVKTVGGRFAGKMLRYETEENNIYFGTGQSGSGKSWAIGQLIPMLFMLGQTVVVFDVSNSFTKEKLLKMLPAEVVEKLFKFINVGKKQASIPVDLGSLRGCETLPDKKRAIYSVLKAATGPLDKSSTRKLKGFLSDYLKDKEYSVSLNDLCSKLEGTGGFGTEVADCVQSVLNEIEEVGFEEQTWDDLFLQEHKIIVINLGNEVGESTHQLLDMMVGSLFNWQMSHDKGFLSIVIDELKDQDFSKGSPLNTIVTEGRKFHTALMGATNDYFNQGSANLDTMKQANIKSFCRPSKSEDRIAQKLGYKDAIDVGFNKFKVGDTIIEFDGYNKETGENEPLTIKGRVVDFVETPLYKKFKEIYDNNN